MNDLSKMQSQDEFLIAVDSQNTPLFPIEKYAAHQKAGQLHRAITVFLFDEQGRTLVTQRSAKKPLWPQWWDAAGSTHQWWPDESAIAAGKRRLPFEIGVSADEVSNWNDAFSYEYHAVYSPEWSENEINFIVTGEYTGDCQLNPDEVADHEWLTPAEIESELTQPNHRFAPWFPLAWERLKIHA